MKPSIPSVYSRRIIGLSLLGHNPLDLLRDIQGVKDFLAIFDKETKQSAIDSDLQGTPSHDFQGVKPDRHRPPQPLTLLETASKNRP